MVNIENLFVTQRGIEHNLAHPSHRALVASEKTDPGHFFEDFCNWSVNEDYNHIIKKSKIGPLAAALMNSQTARLFHDHVLVKEPGTQVQIN